MKTIRKMNHTGDTAVTFDETQVDSAATAEARALFDRLTKGEKASVFTADGRRVERFEDLAEDNVAVPRIVGG